MNSIPDDLITTIDVNVILIALENLDSREDPLYFIKRVGEKEQKYDIMNITFMKNSHMNWYLFYVDARVDREFSTRVNNLNRLNPENYKTDVLEMFDLLFSCGYCAVIGIIRNEKRVMFRDITTEEYKSIKEMMINLNKEY